MDSTYVIPKLAYEVLNISLAELADNLGLTLDMVKDIADKQHWVRWFPDENDNIFTVSSTPIEEEELLDGEDLFTVRADQFLDKNRKRLQVFTMAKELALAEQYASLEVSLVTKAREAIGHLDETDIKSLKDISGIFKDLAKNLQGMSGAVSFAQDESGLPTVIIRDLSGS